MTLKSLIAGAVLALASASAPAPAEAEQVVYRAGDWSVAIETYTTHYACAASTFNRDSERLDITLREDGTLILYMFLKVTNPHHDVYDMTFDIDYIRWEFFGVDMIPVNRNTVAASLDLAYDGDTARFLRQLQSGRAAALKHRDGGNFSTWSLRGSRAAIDALFDCYRSIK